ncbi:hypothetical protein [Desulfosporosinus youngiae]|uniref:hypothetical protein n=1 Tax=Desulfosporosinus youngiae TaxID=339862 RepID=UPI000A014B81|nr:hypothetical protein [Desulfosporosinus youngiae]
MESFSSSDGAATAAWQATLKKKTLRTCRRIPRPASRAASSTEVNPLHGEAVKAYKTVRGDGATGSHQVLP